MDLHNLVDKFVALEVVIDTIIGVASLIAEWNITASVCVRKRERA